MQKSMTNWREYPEKPVIGVGGVVIHNGRALLIRRGGEPLKGEWSIPGGTLELGETLHAGVERELFEETGLRVRVLELIEVFERIFPGDAASTTRAQTSGAAAVAQRPQYHFVIVDYLCAALDPSPAPRPGGDVTHVAFVSEEDLPRYGLTDAATRIIRKAFALARR